MKLGDNILVTRGPFKGESGMIIDVRKLVYETHKRSEEKISKYLVRLNEETREERWFARDSVRKVAIKDETPEDFLSYLRILRREFS